MAEIREDLAGTALALNAIGEYRSLEAGDTIPDGFWVGGHLVEGGDPDDQTPPWAPTNTITSDQISDATEVGVAVLTAADEAAARAAINAAEDAG